MTLKRILMYGCKAWTLIFKEENKLLVAVKKVISKMLLRGGGSWRVRRYLCRIGGARHLAKHHQQNQSDLAGGAIQ